MKIKIGNPIAPQECWTQSFGQSENWSVGLSNGALIWIWEGWPWPWSRQCPSAFSLGQAYNRSFAGDYVEACFYLNAMNS